MGLRGPTRADAGRRAGRGGGAGRDRAPQSGWEKDPPELLVDVQEADSLESSRLTWIRVAGVGGGGGSGGGRFAVLNTFRQDARILQRARLWRLRGFKQPERIKSSLIGLASECICMWVRAEQTRVFLKGNGQLADLITH